MSDCNVRRGWIGGLLAVVLALAGMAGCGTTKGAKREPVFLPPLPNQPRLQFLASYTTSEDVEEHSDFMQFVAGKEDVQKALVKPYGATMLDDRLVVADLGAREVVVFDFAKKQYRALKGNQGGGRAKEPINVTAGEDGSIYVADSARNQILVYGPDEAFQRALGREGDFRPTDVQVRGDEVYVCDVKGNEVVVLDRKTGEVLRRLGGPGREEGKLYMPTNLAVGPDGDLYVTEIGNFRVQRIKPDGTSVRAYGRLGDTPGSLTRPKGVGVDPDGRVYVADAAFENVQIFDPDGRLLLFFGGSGIDAGQLYLPAGIEVTTRGLERFRALADPRLTLKYLVLVVSQYGPHRVSVFGYGDWKAEESRSADQ